MSSESELKNDLPLLRDCVQNIDPEQINSPVIKRLIEDIQGNNYQPRSLYEFNRTHNRHNRGR